MSQHGCPERLSNNMSKGFQEDCPSQPTMEVLVETLTGTAFEMTVSPSDTVFTIKSKIFRVEGIPVSQQHLLYNLVELDDAASLRELSISDGARLRLVLGMRGGPVSTRRLPPPPGAEPWRDLERLLDGHREEREWAGGGCKVTVLVFRDGERVNMLRVRENTDGSYSPLDHAKYSSPASHSDSEPEAGAEGGAEGGAGGPGTHNALTMAKMLELRRRMETLTVQRRRETADLNLVSLSDKPEIQKTRSEESLSPERIRFAETSGAESGAASGEERGAERTWAGLAAYEDDAFAPLYDGNYTRYYDYECSFADRYTLLPPIGSRSESEQSVQSVQELGSQSERVPLDTDTTPAVHADYGGVVWRSRGFGSLSQLTPAPRAPALSGSSTELRQPPRILPSLSRHRNREHLHLSDEGLDRPRARVTPVPPAAPSTPSPPADMSDTSAGGAGDGQGDAAGGGATATAPAAGTESKPEQKERKIRLRCGFCKKRLSISTVHACRCGASFCAPHRYAEVHGCLYDYKSGARRLLQHANPRVAAPKLPKI